GLGLRPGDLEVVVATLAADAQFGGASEQSVYIRTAKHDDDYYIDVVGPERRTVRVNKSGWEYVDGGNYRDPGEIPVKFVRPSGMKPLPEPTRGGNVDRLWEAANIKGDVDRLLTLGFCLECFRPDTPYPILNLKGPPGSAKSSTHRAIVGVIDPIEVVFSNVEEGCSGFDAMAGKQHVLSYENVSALSRQQQDRLCTISTGGGVSKRTLYTTNDVTNVHLHNPVIVNGIHTVVSAPDLISRTITIELPMMADETKNGDGEMTALRGHIGSEVFGGLLDLFVSTLQKLDEIGRPTVSYGRLVDFQHLAEAMSQALGYEANSFSDAYKKRLARDSVATVENSAVGYAVVKFTERPNVEVVINSKSRSGLPEGVVFRGKQGDLFDALRKSSIGGATEDSWPRSTKTFGDQLRLLMPSLKQRGILIREWQSMGRKHIEIKKCSAVFNAFSETKGNL
ncbi:MAG: hypothetical protein ABL893_01435, partial [Hyphomicrobium sp.]